MATLAHPSAETALDAWRGRRVAIAMSGGVDSSVVAALAHAGGAEVVGLTLKLYDTAVGTARAGACCAGSDIRDARGVADRLGFAHYVFDQQSAFRAAVVDDFADSYVAGRTPLPCVRCNMSVKFTDLLALSRELGAEALMTGHYVRRVDGPAGAELHRAVDPARDQSYFLFATTRDQLAHLRFPLGDLPKHRVRAIAGEMGLGVAAKPDSQDICFVPDGDYATLVKRLRPDADRPGAIVDEAGRVLGHHQGLVHFTVGQRRGLALGGQAAPLYVLRLEPEGARVVVGPREALAVAALSVTDANWLAEERDGAVEVKVRSMARPVPAVLAGNRVVFERPEYGVAPGQAAVVYRGDRVLGGGWIAATERARVQAELANG